MKKLLYAISCLILLSLNSNAQLHERGLPFITNYEPTQTGGSEQNWSIVQDKRGVMYFGNHDKGVLEYDGISWRSIPIKNNSSVRSLAIDSHGTIYVGAIGEFGQLVPGINGKLEYISLSSRLDSASADFRQVWSTYAYDERVYFCSKEGTFIYHSLPDSIHILPVEDGLFWSHLVNGKLYHSNFYKGLVVQSGDSTLLMPGGEYFINKYIISILPMSEDVFFIGTLRKGTYLYDKASGTIDPGFIDPDVTQILNDNILYHGILLGNGKLGLSTLNGGFYIIGQDGKLLQRLDKESGLKDQQVISAYVNPEKPGQSPLWLALNIGIGKAEINSPVRMFSAINGLEGAIYDVIRHNGTLYVATSIGVFYLEKSPNRTGRFQRIEGLSTQCFDFTIFTPPEGGNSRLFLATTSGLHEIDKQNILHLLDPEIRNRTEDGAYFLYAQLQSKKDPALLYIAGRSLLTLKFERNRITQMNNINLQDDILTFAEDKNGDIWLTTETKGVKRIRLSDNDTLIDHYSTEHGLPTLVRNYVYNLHDEIYFATTRGLYKFDGESDKFYADTVVGALFHELGAEIYPVMKDRKGRFWVSYEMEGQYRDALVSKTGDSISTDLLPFHRLPNKSTNVFYDDEETVWIGKSTELYRYDDEFEKDYYLPYYSLVREVTLNMDSVVFYGTDFLSKDGRRLVTLSQNELLKPVVKYGYNSFLIKLSAPFFENEGLTSYRYWLEGRDRGWSPWLDRDEFHFDNLRPRHYRFHAKARNVYGIESAETVYAFTVLPPWYQTIIAYISYFILLIVLIVVIVKLYTRRLVMENLKLEGIIEDRTAKIRRQKEELTDSIEYASRIQKALLPSRQILQDEYPQHFILYKPRDIVSGDFYWIGKKNDKVVLVAADCTGHGVPGAFMSMLGISYLNEVVNTLGILESNRILDQLRKHVMGSLKQTGEYEGETKDGMDMGLIVVDRPNMKLQYSGAYNSLYFVRPLSGEEKAMLSKGDEIELTEGAVHNEKYMLEQIKGDKMPIGISAKRSQPFTMHELELKPGYSIYIHSDGYVDQFGGPRGKKFMTKSFKKLLLEIQNIPMKDQGKLLDKRLISWQGADNAQVDDIIVMGIGCS